jgi:hypothetical protein
MQSSAEIRFFWRCPFPPTIDSWFRSGPFPPGGGRREPRVDVYLADPYQRELGIKKRDQKPGVEDKGVEVKGLVALIIDPIKIGTTKAHGELWTKWTTNSLQLDQFANVKVYKTRWLRKFEIKNGLVREIRLGEDEKPLSKDDKLPEQGCNLEFTEVSLAQRGTRWSTLAFESFGPHSAIEANLRMVLGFLAAGTHIPGFEEGEELSYPAWLSLQGPPPAQK